MRRIPRAPDGGATKDVAVALAFLAGAEEASLHEKGCGLTDKELRRVLEEYPGDMPITRTGP